MSTKVHRDKKESKSKTNKEGNRRQTSFDVRASKDLRLTPSVDGGPKKEHRPPTTQEVRANNDASYEYCRSLFDISDKIPRFRTELDRVNDGKVGRKFKQGDQIISWVCEISAYLDLTYREAAGIVTGILGALDFETLSYSRLFERIAMLSKGMYRSGPVTEGRIMCMFCLEEYSDRSRRLIIDSTGLCLTATTRWRLKKWGVGPKTRGWLKMHALTDLDTNEIVAFVLTMDDTADVNMLEYLLEVIDRSGIRYNEIYADGAYSSAENFKLVCEQRECRFITSFKSTTKPRNNGSVARGEAARLWDSLSYDDWVKATGYNWRWKVESAFSDYKRLISEYVSARTTDGIIAEVVTGVRAFNMHKRIRASILGITGNGVQVA